MSTHASKVDEFSSLFRSSLRPVIEIDRLPLKRLLVVVDAQGNPDKQEAVVNVAADMVERFQLQAHLLAPLCRPEPAQASRAESLMERARQRFCECSPKSQVDSQIVQGAPIVTLLQAIDRLQPDMVVLNSLLGEAEEELEGYSLGATVDRLLHASKIPILLIEGAIAEVELLWSDILLLVEDPKTVLPCFSATRSLALKGARVELLKVLDSRWLDWIRQGLKRAPSISSQATYEAIRNSLKEESIHFLESARDALNRTGHNAHFEVLEGDPIEIARARIRSRNYGLVICSSLAPDQKLVDSLAYNLAANLREVPVLLV